jgi:hypothetical protein
MNKIAFVSAMLVFILLVIMISANAFAAGILLPMPEIYWYSPSMSFISGQETDIYVMGAPAGSAYTFSSGSPDRAQITGVQGNRCRARLIGLGEAKISFTVSCTGYAVYTGNAVMVISGPEKPAAVITSINSGYTGETYLFSAANSTAGADGYEWKWHSTANTVITSANESFTKTWTANQYGTYILFLRVKKGSVWSDWTSKSVTVVQGISFNADGIYSGNHTVTDSEWQYIRQKTGSGYEKEYYIGGRKYMFNVELFCDKNLIVYGDYTLDGSAVNSFTAGSEGTPYFSKNGTAGEYKYMGFIYGTAVPFSNQNYKAGNMLILEGTGKNAVMVSFNELPENVKIEWGLNGSTNSSLSVLKDEICGSASYSFINNNTSNLPRPLYLKSVFDLGSLSFDPFSYGLINYFDKFTGGSVRIFFRYYNGGYDWRTFEGPVNTLKQCPEISLSDDIIRRYTVSETDSSISITGSIYMYVHDNRESNIIHKKSAYYFDRNDSYAKDLVMTSANSIRSFIVSEASYEYSGDIFIIRKTVNIIIDRSSLKEGVNSFGFEVSGGISFTDIAKRSGSYAFSIIVDNDLSGRPVVETLGVSGVTGSEASIHYRIHDAGSPASTEAGIFLYDRNSSRYVRGSGAAAGASQVCVSGLKTASLFMYKAYIKQEGVIFYGEERSFSTAKSDRSAPGKPVIAYITADSAYISSDIGSYIVCNGEEKISGSYFYGLSENTRYETHAYFKEDAVYSRSADGESAWFTTAQMPYHLPDMFIYVGQSLTVNDCDSLEIISGNGNIAVDDVRITGVKEGTAYLKGTKNGKQSDFHVYVYPVPKTSEENGENSIIRFTVKKIYDPDFIGISDIDCRDLPVYEHIDSGMIDLGYMVSCETEYSEAGMPDLPEIVIYGPDGAEYIPYILTSGEYAAFTPEIKNVNYSDKILKFDIYIKPQVRFFKKGETVRTYSVQKVQEILLCLRTDTVIDVAYDQENRYIITKKIRSDLLQVFWYNLRRNCYDDIGYEKGW